MTREDSPSDDARDELEDVGGFRFGVADGSGDPEDDRPGASSSGDFLGFDFGRWLQETDVRPSTTPTEPDPVETTDADVAPDPVETTDADVAPDPVETTDADVAPETVGAAPTYDGFDFRQWMADEDAGPRKPPETPRVVGATPAADSSGQGGLLAALPFGGSTSTDSYEGGFAFAEWLGEGDSDFYEPVDVEPATTTAASTPTPEPSATATATAGGSGGFGETPEFPTPPGGGISDTPPVKLAALALFTAALVAVALTAAGAIAPLGPADGFGSSAGGDAQEQPVGTNNSTATATDEQTPEDTPTSTPEPTPTATPTEEPTATPTEEPTATPTEEPTATPTEEPTATPTEEPTATPTPDGGDDGGLLDPITG